MQITLFVTVVFKKLNVLLYFKFSLVIFSPFRKPEFGVKKKRAVHKVQHIEYVL
jgi:hypothetical protein